MRSETASRRCRTAYETVVAQTARLLELAGESEDRLSHRSPRVSAWSVAQHLDHLAQANRVMAGAIMKILAGEAPEAPRGPTLIGRAVLLTGWIPRGAGKAPENVLPETLSVPGIENRLRESERALTHLEANLPAIQSSRGRIDHFAFGGLTPMQWLRTIGVHTRHHLKIIRDIQHSPASPWNR